MSSMKCDLPFFTISYVSRLLENKTDREDSWETLSLSTTPQIKEWRTKSREERNVIGWKFCLLFCMTELERGRLSLYLSLRSIEDEKSIMRVMYHRECSYEHHLVKQIKRQTKHLIESSSFFLQEKEDISSLFLHLMRTILVERHHYILSC